MPLIQAGYQCGHEQSDSRPGNGPARIAEYGDSGAPGAKQQNTQDSVAEDVAGLPQHEMPHQKPDRVHPKKKVQERVQEPAGVLGREGTGGLDGDEPQPDQGRNPCSPDRLTRRWVAAARQENCALMRTESSPHTRLLERIVWSLAGDDDVVNVALAQPRAADAHEARFLLQFRDRGATAVAHPGLETADHLMNDHGD